MNLLAVVRKRKLAAEQSRFPREVGYSRRSMHNKSQDSALYRHAKVVKWSAQFRGRAERGKSI